MLNFQGERDRIDSEAIAEASEFDRLCLAITQERNVLDEQTNGEIAQNQTEFDRVAAKLKTEQETAVSRMRARIEAASKQRQELRDKYESEKTHLLQESRKQLEHRREDNARANSMLFTQVQSRSQDLSDRITVLSAKASELEFRLADPAARNEDTKRIEMGYGRVRRLDEATESTFDGFFTMVRESPGKVNEFEAAPPASARSRNGNNSSSRNSRREISRVVTPLESKNRKRPHVVVNSLAA
jgi:hypothetical protein